MEENQSNQNNNLNHSTQNGNVNNSQNFKSVSPATTESSYKAFQESTKKKKASGASFGKTVVLPFCCGILGTAIVIGTCVSVPPIKNAIVKQLITTNNSTTSEENNNNSSANLNTQLISLQGYSDTAVGVARKVQPSIVAITNVSQTEYQSFWGQSKTYESTSCGSGIIVSQDKEYLYVATNNHVVEGANSLTVTFANDDTVSAEIKGTDPSTDLAVVKVALSSIKDDTMSAIKVATLGSSDTLKVGESCIAIGNALGYGQSVTTGVISALNREVSVSDSSSSTNYTAELIQTDAAINPGNSGGALLNTAGEVIGINSVKYSDTSVEGIGYAIPMDTAKPIIEELITNEKVDESNSAYLGIVGVDVTSDVAKTYNMPTGVYVAQVMEGAAAEQAGIQKGDIITKFDGKDVTSMEELSYNMQYYAAGTTVDVVIERSSNGQYEEQTISVTLGKKN